MYQHHHQHQPGNLPHAPSRFNPNPNPNPDPASLTGFRLGGKRKLSIAQGRGTMSMPTSPLGQSVNNEPFSWDSGVSTLSRFLQQADKQPQSAQAFFSQPVSHLIFIRQNGTSRTIQLPCTLRSRLRGTILIPQPEYPSPVVEYPTPLQSHTHNQTQTQAVQQPTHISPSYLSGSDRTTTLSPSNDLNPNHRYHIGNEHGLEHDEHEEDYDHDHDHKDGRQGKDVPPPRKKRAQVRVACTHCQKACKKCSNTRYVFLSLFPSSLHPRLSVSPSSLLLHS